jgi:ribosomal protein L11
LASVGGQNSSSAMKTIARMLLAVSLVQQCRFVISKENNKPLSSQQKDKQRSTLPINVNNNFIYQFTQERKRTLLNAYGTRAFSKQDRKDSTNELHVSIEKRKPAISSEIQHEITHRKLRTTHRTVQTTHRSPQNTQRCLIEKNAFLSKLTKLKSHNYAAQNLINKQILGTAETNGITRETLKELNKNNKKSKLNVKIMVYDRNFKFESSPTLNESKLENNLSSKISLRPPLQVAFFYHMFKPREVKENVALSIGAELQIKNTFLLPTILTDLRKAILLHPFKIWKLKHKFSSMKDIRVHENELHEVIQNPWNQRLQHKLYKVLRGEDVYLDVFGGSNTLGAGPKKDEGDIEGRFSKVITHWWNKTITPITGSNLKLREIAMGGISS